MKEVPWVKEARDAIGEINELGKFDCRAVEVEIPATIKSVQLKKKARLTRRFTEQTVTLGCEGNKTKPAPYAPAQLYRVISTLSALVSPARPKVS